MRAVTAFEIFLIVFLKGVVVAVLAKFGWWPDWEKVDREKREEKALLRAYNKWRRDAGPDRAADLRALCEDFTKAADNRGAISDRTR